MNQNDFFWIKLAGIVATCVTFAYNTFVPRTELKEAVLNRLDRIENKIDKMLDK